MIQLSDAPINAYSWTCGAIAVYAFTIKSYVSYKRSKNTVAKIYSRLGIWFASGMLLYGVPGFFTTDPSLLRHSYFLADICIQIAMAFGIWLSWFIGFRKYVHLKYMLAVTIPLSIIVLAIEYSTSTARLSLRPHLLVYNDIETVLILKSILYAAVALPLSYFLLRQIPNQTTIRTKFQTFISGVIPAIVALAAISNNIFDKGSDTQQSALELTVFFIVFFLAQLPRPKRF